MKNFLNISKPSHEDCKYHLSDLLGGVGDLWLFGADPVPQNRTSVPLTNGSPLYPAPDPEPTSDPTSFFSDFKDAKKYFFPIFF